MDESERRRKRRDWRCSRGKGEQTAAFLQSYAIVLYRGEPCCSLPQILEARLYNSSERRLTSPRSSPLPSPIRLALRHRAVSHLATEGNGRPHPRRTPPGGGPAADLPLPSHPGRQHKIFCLFQNTLRGHHNVLIPSNLDTEEHLEIGIPLISDALPRPGGVYVVVVVVWGVVRAALDVSSRAMCLLRDLELD